MTEDQNATTGASTGGRRSQAASSTTSQSSAADSTSQATTAGSTEQADSSAANTSWQAQGSTGSSQPTGDQSTQAEGTLVDQLLDRGKKWIDDSNLGQRVNDLPGTLRDLGQQAVSRVGSLSTTQKIVGGAILAAGLGWLATRSRSAKSQSDTDADGAASASRPGSRYSSNAYDGRGSASYASGDASRSNAGGSSRSTSYQRGSHFRTGDADGFSNASDE